MTASAETTARPKRQPERSERHLSILGVIGELLVTGGLLLLLFVAWQLWWTDVLGRQAYETERNILAQDWESADKAILPMRPVKPTYGESFGLLYIPALDNDAWKVPIVEGTTREELQRGIGHHTNGAVPGEIGNLTLAGHRNTYGAPLGNIDQLKSGDEVVVETKFGWYTYQLDRSEIIKPWDGWVLDPVPGEKSSAVPSEALITIYSCHPKYSTAERFVWFGRLVSKAPKSEGKPSAIKTRGTA